MPTISSIFEGLKATAKEAVYNVYLNELGAKRIGYRANTFVVGAIRSGTTSLAELLDHHPHISCGLKKEPAFFSRRYSVNEADFLGNFPVDKDILVDATPDYLFRGVSMARIYRFNPDANIVIMLRDPLKRAISHAEHALKYNWMGPEDIDRVLSAPRIRRNVKRLLLGHQLHDMKLMCVEQSCYDFQIHRAKQMFRNVLVLKLEDWNARPIEQISKLAEFLNVDPTLFSDERLPHVNQGRKATVALDINFSQSIIEILQEQNAYYFKS